MVSCLSEYFVVFLHWCWNLILSSRVYVWSRLFCVHLCFAFPLNWCCSNLEENADGCSSSYVHVRLYRVGSDQAFHSHMQQKMTVCISETLFGHNAATMSRNTGSALSRGILSTHEVNSEGESDDGDNVSCLSASVLYYITNVFESSFVPCTCIKTKL